MKRLQTLYNRIILILVFGIVLLTLSGCEDFLNRYPDNALTEKQIYTDIESARMALVAIYDLISEDNIFGRNIPLRGSVKGTDFFHFTQNPNLRFDTEYKFMEISSSAGYAGYIWYNCYKTIYSSNLMLFSLETLEGDAGEIADMEAQALAAKAICYMELTRAFCYPLWMANDDEQYSMGVPLMRTIQDHTDALESPPERAPLTEVYGHIEEILLEAIEKIDVSRTGKQLFTQQSLWTILARYYTYTEQWPLARDAALEAEKLGGSMLSSDAFLAGMTTPFNEESIFEIYYDLADGLGTNSIAYYAFRSVNALGRIDENSVGYGEYGASDAFIALFAPEDTRTQLFREDKTSSSSSAPGEAGYSARAYHKYMVTSETDRTHNVPYMRLPEVLLMAAEAYAELGEAGNALAYLNKVYSARTNTELTGLTGEALLNEIYRERRRELALEGHELFDYLRTGRSFSRDRSHPMPLSIDPVNGRDDEKFHRVVYPIPQPEMDANPNIRDQQNPGYAAYQGSN